MTQNVILVSGIHQIITIFLRYKMSHNKSGYHLSPYKIILTTLPVLYFTHPMTYSFYNWKFVSFSHPSPVLPTPKGPHHVGNQQFCFLYLSIWFCCMFGSTNKWNHTRMLPHWMCNCETWHLLLTLKIYFKMQKNLLLPGM